MPSLRDEAHDGWLSIVTTVNNNSWKFHQDAAGQLLSGQPVLYGKVREYGTSITHKITPTGSLSSSQPGGQPCWASHLAYRIIRYDNMMPSPASSPSQELRIWILGWTVVYQGEGRFVLLTYLSFSFMKCY